MVHRARPDNYVEIGEAPKKSQLAKLKWHRNRNLDTFVCPRYLSPNPPTSVRIYRQWPKTTTARASLERKQWLPNVQQQQSEWGEKQ